jgi:hypothetical protein
MGGSSLPARAAAEPLTVALLPLEATDPEDRGAALEATEGLYVGLALEKKLQLVERERLEELLREQALALAGLASEEKGLRVGRLLSARIVIVGRVVKLREARLLTVRLIGTETSRLLVLTEVGEGVSLSEAGRKLGASAAETLVRRGPELVASGADERDVVKEIQRELRDRRLPRATVAVPERFRGAAVVDPAVETELIYTLSRCGFEVIDAAQIRRAARDADFLGCAGDFVDVVIQGESLLEPALTVGDLHAGRARVELKAVEPRTGRILAVARLSQGALDVSPAIAAKAAAEQATRKLAVTFIPELVTAWNRKR